MRNPMTPILFAPLLLALGCAATPRDATYTVTVRNETNVAVMLWLTKDGPPVDAQWLSAAQWQALSQPGEVGLVPAVTAGARSDVTLGPRRGRFAGSTRAVLDAFPLPMTPAAMADLPPDSPNHARLALRPGVNAVRVVSLAPLRLERTSVESLRQEAAASTPRPESRLPFRDNGAPLPPGPLR